MRYKVREPEARLPPVTDDEMLLLRMCVALDQARHAQRRAQADHARGLRAQARETFR